MKLVIGNKNYSSWSLRPWLLLQGFGVVFEEIQVSLESKTLSEDLKAFSASARVPVLIDDDVTVWDSLAICEYINETCLQGRGWPEDVKLRAIARAVTSEMHSGFMALRSELPMNCRATRYVVLSNQALKDIERIDEIFSAATGDFLLGDFSIADCFFAPVVLRFKTYQIALSAPAAAYARRMLEHPSLIEWIQAAVNETAIVTEDEAGVDV